MIASPALQGGEHGALTPCDQDKIRPSGLPKTWTGALSA